MLFSKPILSFTRSFPILWKATFATIFFAASAQAQILITSTNPITENFNSMGGNTILPQGWRISYGTASPTWLSGQTSLIYTASNGMPTAYGSYAWGNTQRNDWSVGVLEPKATKSSVMMFVTNASGQTLNSWTVSYAIEEYYRNNADAVINFYYSMDGASWTSINNGVQYLIGTKYISPVGYLFDSPQAVNKAVSPFLTPSIEIGSSIYFRWEISVAGPLDQGWGLDDIAITPGFSPVPETSTVGMIGLGLSVFAMLTMRRRLSPSLTNTIP